MHYTYLYISITYTTKHKKKVAKIQKILCKKKNIFRSRPPTTPITNRTNSRTNSLTGRRSNSRVGLTSTQKTNKSQSRMNGITTNNNNNDDNISKYWGASITTPSKYSSSSRMYSTPMSNSSRRSASVFNSPAISNGYVIICIWIYLTSILILF